MASESADECYWVTTASPTVEAVVNPLAAACHERGYVPDVVRLLRNPDVREASEETIDYVETVVAAHGDEPPDVQPVTIDSERDFEAIVDYHRESVAAAAQAGASVAVDVTPGRKFMSAIAFQAGIQFDADRVFYLYLDSADYYDRVYPDIPRTGSELVDFSEVFG
jgi:S-methylmethionine-dependent homocysteine/selenocysteine methylase